MSLRSLERHAFNQFDGADIPEPFAGQIKKASPIVSVDLEINNGAAVDLWVELFAGGVSFTQARRAAWDTGNYNYVPFDAYDDAASGLGIVGFNADGDLVITGGELEGELTVSCGQLPYRQLLDMTKARAFRVQRTRATFTTDAQISNKITHFVKSFLGGRAENEINPRRFFSPDQNQSLIVDITAPFRVDSERGLYLKVKAGELITLNMEVSEYTSNEL